MQDFSRKNWIFETPLPILMPHETPAPQPPGRGGKLTHFQPEINGFLTAAIYWVLKQVYKKPARPYNNYFTPDGREKPVTVNSRLRDTSL